MPSSRHDDAGIPETSPPPPSASRRAARCGRSCGRLPPSQCPGRVGPTPGHMLSIYFVGCSVGSCFGQSGGLAIEPALLLLILQGLLACCADCALDVLWVEELLYLVPTPLEKGFQGLAPRSWSNAIENWKQATLSQKASHSSSVYSYPRTDE